MEAKQRNFSILYVVAAVFLLLVFQSILIAPHTETLSYSEFKTLLKRGKVSDLILDKQTISGSLAADGLEGLLPKEKVEELKRAGGGQPAIRHHSSR